ncbi:hypothetical protein FRZ61_37140 [Hypericibacter adhaerens]|jgi:hypothetical protein|uniref:Uncharacterized protein n=1 Tax=Hypericibacter adhaerens TaxID=2602016 RepID=A0A5J6N4C9_9PROT|nr:hypothetical protein [Hypericibacter adhaerens]QEX23775.1 hypothetical protein FRZ61_37140 [Hypericibacter adhaerens]
MTVTFKPLPPPAGAGGEPGLWAYLRRCYDALRGIQAGKLNCTTTVTLAASATTTLLNDPRIGPASVILFMPMTAHAATAAGGLHVSARAAGSATFTHTNTADVDKTFGVIIIG